MKNLYHLLWQYHTFFFSTLQDKGPGEIFLTGHSVLMMQTQYGTRLQKTKSVVVNKTGKVEVDITDNALEQLP